MRNNKTLRDMKQECLKSLPGRSLVWIENCKKSKNKAITDWNRRANNENKTD